MTIEHELANVSSQQPHHPYLELEAHGPVATLAPGERTTLVERRRVFDVPGWHGREADVLALGRSTGALVRSRGPAKW